MSTKTFAREDYAVAFVQNIALEYGPAITEDEARYIIWNETGWPCFWPDSRAASPNAHFAVQVREFFQSRGMA